MDGVLRFGFSFETSYVLGSDFPGRVFRQWHAGLLRWLGQV